MKKLYYLIPIGIALASCNQSSNNVKTAKENSAKILAANTHIEITLNGVDATTAAAEIKQFVKYRSQDTKPARESVWFDSATIHNMVNLLNKEIIEQRQIDKKRTDTTDGIRIYFTSDTTVSTGQLNNSIVFVSTKNDGVDNTVPSGAIHRDYYTHSKTDILFQNLNSIKGEIATRQMFNTRGENLYNIYFNPFSREDISICKDPHYISRGKGNKMVNQFGKNPITTNSEWFDINLFRAFAADTIHDGVRVYFARHPEKYNNKPDTNKFKEAFILITTKRKKIFRYTYHKDYFNCKTTQGYLNTKSFLKWHKLHPLDDGDGGDDNGEICPTHCNPPASN